MDNLLTHLLGLTRTQESEARVLFAYSRVDGNGRPQLVISAFVWDSGTDGIQLGAEGRAAQG